MPKKIGDGDEFPSLMQFPCHFSIKVMGKNSADFTDLVVGIVREHFPNFNEEQLKKRFSQFTNYMSLTVTVYAENQAQLDNLYRHLSGNPQILIVI